MNNDIYDNLPTDTPPEVLKIQVEVIQALTYSERLRIACGLADFSYQQTMNMLRRKLGTTDENMLKIAFVETVYKDDFTGEELERIRNFFNKGD